MALVVKDRIKETSSTTGTGTLTLGGAVDGFRTFADVGNGNTTYYCIEDGNNFEVGIGTYTASGTTLSRDTVLQTSAGNTTKINCSGSQKVFVTQPADKAVFEDASGDTKITNNLLVGTDVGSYNTSNFEVFVSNADQGTTVCLYDDNGAYNSALIKYDSNVLSLGLNNANSANTILTTSAINVTSTGVGIGTTSPQRPLVLYKNDSGQTQIQFQNQTTGTANSDGFGVGLDTQEDGFLWNYEGGDIYLGGATASRIMTLKGSSGNIGIGINSPSQNLHISSSDHTRALITGGTNKYAELQFENDAQKFGMGVQDDDKFFLYNSTGTTQVLTVDTSSKVGIHTQSPGTDLHVKGTMKIEGDTSYYADTLAATNSTSVAFTISPSRASVTKSIAMGAIGSSNTHTGLQAYDSSDNSANNFSINPLGGNVGINTSSPANFLHVQGSSEAAITVGSASTRSGIFIFGPGSTTTRGSMLCLAADNTFRLGTQSYYHQEMRADGTTILNGGGNEAVKVETNKNAVFRGDIIADKYLRLRTTDDQANQWYVYTHTDDTFRLNYNGSGGDELTIATNGNATFSGTVSAPAFDFTSTGGPIYFGSGTDDYLYLQDVGTSGNSLAFVQDSSTKFSIQGTSGNATFVGDITFSGSNHILADFNSRNLQFVSGGSGSDVGLFLKDAGSTASIQIYGTANDHGFLDSAWGSWDLKKTKGAALYLNNNTTYYLNPASTSHMNTVDVDLLKVGGSNGSSGQVLTSNGTSTPSWQTPSSGGYSADFSGYANKFSVGTSSLPSTGEIRATSNITAYYSDERLKDFHGKIENAVDKVKSLNGYYYSENEKAKEYGYEKQDKKQVGVSAQEVEKVLPEIVSLAPFDIAEDGTSKSGEDYKTVDYEKLVPLLIEAIKEQQTQIDYLKEKLNGITE